MSVEERSVQERGVSGDRGEATPAFVPTEVAYRGGRALAGTFFTSAAILDAEIERIFRRSWLCCGRASELSEPGEFLLSAPAGESVIVVRDAAGTMRAFHNVCRHRGTRLCEGPRGRFPSTIQCPYHAWTYALDGRLVGAPNMDGAEDFDPAAHGLHPVALQTWEGFLFVNLADEPEPLESAFGPLIGRFIRFGIPDLRPARRVEYAVAANWKLLCENYSECLHCPVVHPGLARLSPYRSGENDLVEGPFLGGFMAISREGGSLTLSGAACGRPVGDLPREDLGRVYYYTIFPNLLLSLHPDYVMYHTLWPIAPDRTRVVCEWLFHRDSLGDPAFDPEDAIGFWDRTNREDWHICERSQAGVSSRAYAPGPYSPRESLVAAWDREYLRRLGPIRATPDGSPGVESGAPVTR